jgi:hypothetical protein
MRKYLYTNIPSIALLLIESLESILMPEYDRREKEGQEESFAVCICIGLGALLLTSMVHFLALAGLLGELARANGRASWHANISIYRLTRRVAAVDCC